MSGTNDPWKKIPPDLRDRTATRVLDANDPQILVEWKPGNQQWSSLRHVCVQHDGRVFWRNNQRPTGLLVKRAPVQSHSSFTQGMEGLTIDVQAAIPHTSLTQNMGALNIDSPPSYGLLSNSISVNANLSNVVSIVVSNVVLFLLILTVLLLLLLNPAWGALSVCCR